MKERLILILIVLSVFSGLLAQKPISGTVINQSGEPLIGANVLIKGTSSGTATNIDGFFELTMPPQNNILEISYAGYTTLEVAVGLRTEIEVTLQEGITLSEAVVTGLNIKREQKTLSYSVQQVGSVALNPVVNKNVVESLGGKVAGIQVINTSAASMSGTSKIRIRGVTGLTGGNPLFVVDGTVLSNDNYSTDNVFNGYDYGSLINDINPEDVESISVLKGPAATAIYGERGKGGVIVISLKKGTKRQGIGISVSSSLMVENVYILPDFQNEYAGGYAQKWNQDPLSGHNILNYAADESWGPRIDGTLYRPWYSWYPGTPEYGQQIPLEAHPDNVRNFFETGITYNNSVAINGGNDQSTFRLSYKNVSQNGVMPKSTLHKHNLGIVTNHKITGDLSLEANINFVDEASHARPGIGYNSSYVGGMNQWFQRQLDMSQLRNYIAPDGSYKSWNIRSTTNLRPLYWDSPYFYVDHFFPTDSRIRYFGNIRLTYRITDRISVTTAVNRDDYEQRIQKQIGDGGLLLSSYSELVASGREDNYDIRLDFTQNFGNFSLDANIGGNKRVNEYHFNFMQTVGGLNSVNLFTIGASTDRPIVNGFMSQKKVNSIFGALNVGYQDWLYLSGTVRNDWSSALPTQNNSYLYPSAGVSIVFSELIKSGFLSFGKLRASIAQVGSDIAPYQTSFAYQAGVPYGSNPSFRLPNTSVNETISPSLSTSYEFGIDMKFFGNRMGLDLAYYNVKNTNEILTLQVPGSSGFSSAWINAGEIESKGFEVTFNATPIQTTDFNWDISVNVATNKSIVNELAEGLDNYQLGSEVNWGLTVNAPVGEEWGQFRGTGFTYDDQGRKVLTPDGRFVKNRNQWLGSFIPDATGGFRTDITYKGIRLGAFVDFQIGGLFSSRTQMLNEGSGVGSSTVGLNDKGNPIRDPVDQGGGRRIDGVLQDGTAATFYVNPQNHFWLSTLGLHEEYLYSSTYAKLREVSLGYNIPSKIIAKTPFRTIGISLVGKNLWLMYADERLRGGIDPSEITMGSSNYTAGEAAILPGVRSMGVNLKLEF